MDYPTLVSGTLLRRYKRFLADVRLEDGREVVAHCPNTGSMRAVNVPGSRVWLAASDNPARKLEWSWELIELEQPDGDFALASVHTGRANRIVEEALAGERVPKALSGYTHLKREVRVGESRLDFCLTDGAERRCYIEVKQVTLREPDGHGYFPDAVSTRGRRHLECLAERVAQGHRAVLLFLVAHQGIDDVAPASHLDPAYSEILARVAAQGVEVMAHGIEVRCDAASRPLAICMGRELPVRIPAAETL